jgi:hypothetical protein
VDDFRTFELPVPNVPGEWSAGASRRMNRATSQLRDEACYNSLNE